MRNHALSVRGEASLDRLSRGVTEPLPWESWRSGFGSVSVVFGCIENQNAQGRAPREQSARFHAFYVVAKLLNKMTGNFSMAVVFYLCFKNVIWTEWRDLVHRVSVSTRRVGVFSAGGNERYGGMGLPCRRVESKRVGRAVGCVTNRYEWQS
uniref:Uncharacterized protein n=1 Tax=Candidatus Kentrum sp. LFY TaxID=2126342 RepID=A0A450UB78_9GAMM|nr:MAG: hypothetical protein BECKLFY1418B_GA0070995_101539 [Candidatus Kentron sp. LFY]